MRQSDRPLPTGIRNMEYLFDYKELLNVTSSIPYIDASDPVSRTDKFLVTAHLSLVAVLAVLVNAINLIRNQRGSIITKALSLSDLLTTVLVSVFETTTFLSDGKWIFPSVTCTSVAFCQTTLVFSGAGFVCYVALIRYRSVFSAHSSNHHCRATDRNHLTAVVAIWLLCAVLSGPLLAVYTLTEAFILTQDYRLVSVNVCAVKENVHPHFVTIYFVTVPVLLFVPLAFFVIYAYSRIVHFFRIRKPVGDVHGQSSVNREKRKKKITRDIILLMLSFIACKSPIYFYLCIRQLAPLYVSPHQRIIHEILIIFLLSNGVANPFFDANFTHRLCKPITNVKKFFQVATPGGGSSNQVTNKNSTRQQNLQMSRH